MKTKFRTVFVLAILMMCMSSCVYSLFPIYTEDTLVYLPELEGKWILDQDRDFYLLFEKSIDLDATMTVNATEETDPDPAPSNGLTTTKKITYEINDDAYIVQNGDTIRDKEKIKEFYRQQIDSSMKQLGEAMGETLKGMGEAFKKITRAPNPKGFISDTKTYLMTMVDGEQTMKYHVHLAQIGDELYMDLYVAEDDYTDKAMQSMTWFPVHTFMKMELDGNQLRLTQFDLEKLNKLFDTGLIRMSHEIVDGTVLITAKPEELQKFIKKYSRDASVFDEVEIYSREAQ